MSTLAEPEVEEAALQWMEGLGWSVKHGPDIAPGTPDAERDSYDQVILERQLPEASSFTPYAGQLLEKFRF